MTEMGDRHRDFATVYLETGLRRGELMNLLSTDVDLQAGRHDHCNGYEEGG